MSTSPTNLKDLLTAIEAGMYTDTEMTELPTFGGDEPERTEGVWSWDATHLLVGTCADDMRIVRRAVTKAAGGSWADNYRAASCRMTADE